MVAWVQEDALLGVEDIVLDLRIWDFPQIRVPDFGALKIRILLFRLLYQGPLFSETPYV